MVVQKAVVDRVEEAVAVLLVGDREEELVVPREKLPKEAVAGTWLLVEIEKDKLVKAELDAEETGRRRERVAEKMRRLLSRGG